MAYSKAYQTVIAGRVREDEVDFYGKNKVATPAGSFTTKSRGGVTKLPTFKKEYLKTEFVGKARDTYVADTDVQHYSST